MHLNRTSYSSTIAVPVDLLGAPWVGEEGGDLASHYYRARYYDPKAGRFISEDPIGFWGGLNFYDYVGANPALFGDPLGLQHDLRPVKQFPAGTPFGPAITMNQGGYPPNLIDRRLAEALEGAARSTGHSMGVSSTASGHDDPSKDRSRHNVYCGVDISRVDGHRVDEYFTNPDVRAAVDEIVAALEQNRSTEEVFRPTGSQRRRGSTFVPAPGQDKFHGNHIHVSVPVAPLPPLPGTR